MRSTINLYEGDCLPAMRKMADNQYSLCICDPPYGIDFAKTHTGNGWIVRKSKDWDKQIPSAEYFKQLFRVSKDQIICGGNYFTKYLPFSMGWVFWDKGQRNFSLADGELIFTSFNRALRVFEYSRAKLNNNREGIHPTEKPVALYKWLLKNYAKPGDTILDTHGGSMSIAIACWDAGHDLDLYEIDKDYFEAGKKRLENHKAQLQIF